jgi:hypothetical protein
MTLKRHECRAPIRILANVIDADVLRYNRLVFLRVLRFLAANSVQSL